MLQQPRMYKLQTWILLFIYPTLARKPLAVFDCIDAPGDFAVRRSRNDAPLCFLCSVCCKRDHVVGKLQRERATLDVTGLSGKALYTEKGSKFVSEVNAASNKAPSVLLLSRGRREK